MATNLDHIYGDSGTSASIKGLETKITNLSNIAVKNNIANQRIPQQRITQEPSQDENVMRLWDIKYTRIVNHTTPLTNANTLWEWTGAPYQNQRIHSFVIKVAINNVDYLWDWQCYIENKNYRNQGPTFSFASADNLTETAKIKVGVHNNKFQMISNVPVQSVLVYMRYDHYRN